MDDTVRRRIIVYIATSADGFIARPDGAVDWLDRPRPKGNYGMGEFLRSIDTILWGRKTMSESASRGGAGGFGSALKNYVFSGIHLPSQCGVSNSSASRFRSSRSGCARSREKTSG
jgi:hypothetical protein